MFGGKKNIYFGWYLIPFCVFEDLNLKKQLSVEMNFLKTDFYFTKIMKIKK